MALDDTIDTVEQLCEAEQSRERRFRNELAAFERGEIAEFGATRAVMDRERSLLDQLDELLVEERGRLARLDDAAASLTTDQALDHRDASLTKLRAHNDLLQDFSDSLARALSVIAANLDELEANGIDAELDDPQQHLQACRAALEEHNRTVEGLERNLRILKAYLL
jgi:chromosome segregation ATPase